MRQSFIQEGVYLHFAAAFQLITITDHEASGALPRKGSNNEVLRHLARDWRSCFAAREAWKAAPSPFLGRPRWPRYQDQQQGRTLLLDDFQASSLTGLRRGEGLRSPLGSRSRSHTKQTALNQLRSVPRKGCDVVAVIDEREPAPAAGDPAVYAGIASGLNNLAALTSHKAGVVPRSVTGRPVKARNQCYNKRKAEGQQKRGTTGTTRQLERLTAHRTRQIDHYLHTAARRSIDLLVAEGLATRCIGKKPLCKQNARMGKRTHQHLVAVPHARFIARLADKAELVGIQGRSTAERYTSKASFLDADPLPVDDASDIPAFSGRRVKRGLYRAADGRHINADVHGSYNTIRKVLPDVFGQGLAGAAVHPVRLPVRTKRVA